MVVQFAGWPFGVQVLALASHRFDLISSLGYLRWLQLKFRVRAAATFKEAAERLDYFAFGSHNSMRVPSGSVTQVKRP